MTKNQLKSQTRQRRLAIKHAKHTAKRNVTRAVNAWFAKVIATGHTYGATPAEQLKANIAFIHWQNRKEKQLEVNHRKWTADEKAARRARSEEKRRVAQSV